MGLWVPVEEAEAQESCPTTPPCPEERHGEEPGDVPHQLKRSETELSTSYISAEEQTDTWGSTLSSPVLVSKAGSGSWV